MDFNYPFNKEFAESRGIVFHDLKVCRDDYGGWRKNYPGAIYNNDDGTWDEDALVRDTGDCIIDIYNHSIGRMLKVSNSQLSCYVGVATYASLYEGCMKSAEKGKCVYPENLRQPLCDMNCVFRTIDGHVTNFWSDIVTGYLRPVDTQILRHFAHQSATAHTLETSVTCYLGNDSKLGGFLKGRLENRNMGGGGQGYNIRKIERIKVERKKKGPSVLFVVYLQRVGWIERGLISFDFNCKVARELMQMLDYGDQSSNYLCTPLRRNWLRFARRLHNTEFNSVDDYLTDLSDLSDDTKLAFCTCDMTPREIAQLEAKDVRSLQIWSHEYLQSLIGKSERAKKKHVLAKCQDSKLLELIQVIKEKKLTQVEDPCDDDDASDDDEVVIIDGGIILETYAPMLGLDDSSDDELPPASGLRYDKSCTQAAAANDDDDSSDDELPPASGLRYDKSSTQAPTDNASNNARNSGEILSALSIDDFDERSPIKKKAKAPDFPLHRHN